MAAEVDRENKDKILMEPLGEFAIVIKRAGVSNQGVPPARAMTIAPKTKPAAMGQIPASGTKPEALNRSSSEDNGGDKGKCKQAANRVHDQAGDGGVKQDPGFVSLRGVNLRWSSAREDDEHAKTFGELVHDIP